MIYLFWWPRQFHPDYTVLVSSTNMVLVTLAALMAAVLGIGTVISGAAFSIAVYLILAYASGIVFAHSLNHSSSFPDYNETALALDFGFILGLVASLIFLKYVGEI